MLVNLLNILGIEQLVLRWSPRMEYDRRFANLARLGNQGEHNDSVLRASDGEMYLQSKNKIVKKLRERCHGNVDEQEISRRLDNQELSQFCVHISSTGHWERTQDFARKLGFEDRAVVRRQHLTGGYQKGRPE